MNQKGFTSIILILFILVAAGIGGWYLLNQSSFKSLIPTPTPNVVATPTPNPTANWKTYTYKNISFQYPLDWEVIFDSEVFGQLNGFSLHAQSKDATGYQPDGLYLSTFNDRSNNRDGYILNQERRFVENKNGSSNIQFDINGLRIYAGCAFYSEGQATINICNQILSTFKFL